MPLLAAFFNHALRYPAPSNLTNQWGFGSLLMSFFALQVLTGLLVGFFYKPDANLAFESVVYLINDIYNGFLIKYIHLNAVSFIFAFMYLHLMRGLYHCSYFTLPAVWITGMALFMLTVLTAFLGYVLPWGQMSFWAATVITNLITVLPEYGGSVLSYVLGGFAVTSLTLNRFFIFHFAAAVVILTFINFHLMILHHYGSSNPELGLMGENDKTAFFHLYFFKDTYLFLVAFLGLCYMVFLYPNYLNHSDNFNMANPMVTPAHIVPEWYFLPFYAILRSIPSKVLGVLAMIASIGVFFVLPLLCYFGNRAELWLVKIFMKHFALKLSTIMYLLGVLGSLSAEEPFIGFAQFYGFLIVLFVVLVRFIQPLTDVFLRTRRHVPKWRPYLE